VSCGLVSQCGDGKQSQNPGCHRPHATSRTQSRDPLTPAVFSQNTLLQPSQPSFTFWTYMSQADSEIFSFARGALNVARWRCLGVTWAVWRGSGYCTNDQLENGINISATAGLFPHTNPTICGVPDGSEPRQFPGQP
jgi:hypothetical protein